MKFGGGYCSVGYLFTKDEENKDRVLKCPIGKTTVTRQEAMSNILEALNRFYKSLLISIYELYARTVSELYACLGFLDQNLWLCSDFGKLLYSEVQSKNLEWYYKLRMRHENRSQVNNTVGRLRMLFPSAITQGNIILQHGSLRLYSNGIWPATIETVSIYDATRLLEVFRHICVHEEGRFGGTTELLGKVGLNGQKYYAFIMQFAKSVDGNNRVWLIYEDNHDMFDFLLGYFINIISAHVCIFYQCACERFGFISRLEKLTCVKN